jgi:GTPase SAR1 family protein
MFHVTIVGDTRTGKSALCQQWSGAPFATSYITTFLVEDYIFDNMIIHDTPSHDRFLNGIDTYYIMSDVIILIVTQDEYTDKWYSKIKTAHNVQWVLILNGAQKFPEWRRWALFNDVRVINVDLSTGFNVSRAFDLLNAVIQDCGEPNNSGEVVSLDNLHYYLENYGGWCGY